MVKPDWQKVADAAAALLVAAKSTGYSDAFDPSKKCLYDTKKIAKELGYKLIKE